MWNNFLQLEVKMSGESKIDQSMDLRGVSCPLNYVKAKLRLEEMEVGQVLETLLDDGEPIVNVPRSTKEDGHKVIQIMQIEDYFKVLVKKEIVIE